MAQSSVAWPLLGAATLGLPAQQGMPRAGLLVFPRGWARTARFSACWRAGLEPSAGVRAWPVHHRKGGPRAASPQKWRASCPGRPRRGRWRGPDHL